MAGPLSVRPLQAVRPNAVSVQQKRLMLLHILMFIWPFQMRKLCKKTFAALNSVHCFVIDNGVYFAESVVE